jgi:hypothetical protein
MDDSGMREELQEREIEKHKKTAMSLYISEFLQDNVFMIVVDGFDSSTYLLLKWLIAGTTGTWERMDDSGMREELQEREIEKHKKTAMSHSMIWCRYYVWRLYISEFLQDNVFMIVVDGFDSST